EPGDITMAASAEEKSSCRMVKTKSPLAVIAQASLEFLQGSDLRCLFLFEQQDPGRSPLLFSPCDAMMAKPPCCRMPKEAPAGPIMRGHPHADTQPRRRNA